MIKKADICIILFVFLIISVSFFVSVFSFSASSGELVEIYIDGMLSYSYSLPVSQKKEIEISNKYGTNLIIIDKNTVWVKSSDCIGKDCVETGKIKNSGEFIICAPHRLYIEIKNFKEELYAVTY